MDDIVPTVGYHRLTLTRVAEWFKPFAMNRPIIEPNIRVTIPSGRLRADCRITYISLPTSLGSGRHSTIQYYTVPSNAGAWQRQ